ncbi:unnamed protein product [Chironomus riparius]|uniref:Major facilitator superfamily (MFS) profile domain-containing protein n=1 Tax=Chironomus riparius TaxID=315576 RepID=A0A9N9WR73_9DIPT|nr:unnamed protein product [Chironomus riparius]
MQEDNETESFGSNHQVESVPLTSTDEMGISTYSFKLEDAIAKANFGKFNYVLITLSGIILTSGMLDITSMGMVLPIAQCDLNLSNSHKGFLGSVTYIGVILSSHFWGFAADTKGRKKVLVPALILSFATATISSFATSFWFLALMRFLNGIFICASQSIIYAFMGEFHVPKRRAKIMMLASVVYGIASLMNPISGVVLLNLVDWSFYIPFLDLQFKTWRMFLIVCTIPNLISAILLIFLIPESPKYTFSQGDEAKTLEILRDIFRRNTGRSILEYEVKSLIKDKEFNEANSKASKGFFKFMWTQTAPLFKHPHMKNTMTACYLQFSILITINGFWTFFPEIQNKTYIWMANHPSDATSTVCGILESFHHKNQTVAAIKSLSHCTTHLRIDTFINITIISVLYTVGWTVCSFIIDYTGKLLIIVLIMLICGICSALMMFVNIPSISVYLYVILQTAGLNMTIINSSTVELFPTSLRAMAVSISMMVGRIGSAVGSNFLGFALDRFCTYTWLLPCVLLLSSGLLSFTIPDIGKRRKHETTSHTPQIKM